MHRAKLLSIPCSHACSFPANLAVFVLCVLSTAPLPPANAAVCSCCRQEHLLLLYNSGKGKPRSSPFSSPPTAFFQSRVEEGGRYKAGRGWCRRPTCLCSRTGWCREDRPQFSICWLGGGRHPLTTVKREWELG